MHINSGLNTVSSLYGQQKGNHMKTTASAGKPFTGNVSESKNTIGLFQKSIRQMNRKKK